MKCWFGFIVVLGFIMAANWSTVHADKKCDTSFNCDYPYKSCCNSRCSYRRYCSNNCYRRSDCASNEYCVHSTCKHDVPYDYCDIEVQCSGNRRRCENNMCTKYCECAGNERCNNGKCEKKDSGHTFTPASIIGFTAVVVIGSCIACSLYCGCARRGRHQRAQRAQQRQSPQLQVQQTLEEERTDNITPNNDPTDGLQSPPLHPGGPPPYHSLEMIDVLKHEPPPPNYQEAMRNSHNDLTHQSNV